MDKKQESPKDVKFNIQRLAVYFYIINDWSCLLFIY